MGHEMWEALGTEGWRWANVLPYFQRLENVAGGGALRGTGGPISVRRGDASNQLYQAFVDAGQQAGYAVSDNMNSRQHQDFGPVEMNVGGGGRFSAAAGYLHPAVKRGNVRVITHALVDRLTVVDGRVTGVLFSQNGRPVQA